MGLWQHIDLCLGGVDKAPIVTDATDRTFDAVVLKMDVPVVVLFCAGWSAACQSLRAKLGEMSDEFAGLLKCAAVDVDANNPLTSRYQVVSVPTLIVFKNGIEALRMERVSSLETVWEKILEQVAADELSLQRTAVIGLPGE